MRLTKDSRFELRLTKAERELLAAKAKKAGISSGEFVRKIICDTECNPLHGPRVQEIIEKLEAGEEVDKQAYVDEEMFAADDTVTSIKVDDADYEVTTITQDIIDGRAY